jgi:hypothetical protein
LTNPKKRVTKFKQLVDGEKYNVYSRYEQSFVQKKRRHQIEDKAMEKETLLAMKSFLINHVGHSVIEMPTDIMGSDGKTIVQEWDAVFKVDDVLYLCVAKHNMTLKHLLELPQRIKLFNKIRADAQDEFLKVNKIVGVLCGNFFPSDIRDCAHLCGYICVYPLGNRYGEKSPPKDFVIER